MDQLRLDLNDRQQYLYAYLRQTGNLGNNCDWTIFCLTSKENQPHLFLGLRTSGLGGTDYEYKKNVSEEEAVWLLSLKDFHVYEHVDAIIRYRNAKNGK